MRIAVFLALLMVPLAVAQAPMEVATDPAGDVRAAPAGATVPAGTYDYLDLVGVTVQETEETFVFQIEVADIRPASEESTEGGFLNIQFFQSDMEMRVQVGRVFAFGGFQWAAFEKRNTAGGGWGEQWSSSEALQIDTATDTYTVVVPRTDMTDSHGAPPNKGHQFTEFYGEAFGLASEFDLFFAPEGLEDLPWEVTDRMPDTGRGTTALPVTLGLEQTGSAYLTSHLPRRASNGEASTFVFRVNATNTGSSPDVFTLRTTGVPSNWAVTMPQPVVELAGGESREVPVVLATPFAHQHGNLQTFVLEMTSVNDAASVGRIELGITYLAIPQPAGHHDTVYLHSRNQGFGLFQGVFAGQQTLYMNAAETHEGDLQQPVTGRTTGTSARNGEPNVRYQWVVPLDPGLQMGLDFDITRKGSITLPMETTMLQPGASLSGSLVVYEADADFNPRFYQQVPHKVLATFASQPADFGPDQSQTYDLELTITPDADLVPYLPAQSLVLDIRMNTTRPGLFTSQEAPSILPGASMRLPLFEYHDPIIGNFAGSDALRMQVEGAASVVRNPGTTALFRVTLEAAKGNYDLQLLGVNTQWATIAQGSRVSVGNDGRAAVEVVVVVPADAPDGERADLVLEAKPRGGGAGGLARLLVEVDTDGTHPDDAEAAKDVGGPAKDTPGLMVPVLVGVLLFALRRRQV